MIILFLLVLVPIILYHKFAKKPNKNQIPSPPALPLIGNLHQLGRLPHQSLWQLAKRHGPVMMLRLGRVSTVVVSSPEAAKTVMKTHDLDSCSRPQFECGRKLTYGFRDLGFSAYSEYWREMRKISVLELFSVRRVRSYWPVREGELAKMLESISDHASSCTPFDLTEAAFSLTASVIFRIAFGTSFEETGLCDSKFHEVVAEVATFMGSFCAAEYFPYVGWIIDSLSGLNRRHEAIFRKIDELFQRVIDAHRDPARVNKLDSDDIIDVFLNIMKDETGFGASLSETNIKAVLLNMFLGGIDTAAITIVWAMAELTKRPNLMKKAQDEVRSCFKNKLKGTIIDETDIEKLDYLKMIVKETLRLHPPATLTVSRETMSHFKLEGYDIPPKTIIQVNAWAIGRDPSYWKDPEEFVPERFADSPIDYKGQHFGLLPFGSGRRMCPAIYMGASLVELGLANMLYGFDWKLPDGMKEEDLDMGEKAGQSLTVSKKTPLVLVPVMHHENYD